jgi:hypothetical protein
MSESYRPYVEAESVKEEAKDQDKKDKKKHGHSSHESHKSTKEKVDNDRPQKLGSKMLRPLAIELPKSKDESKDTEPADERADQEPTHVEETPEPVVAEAALPPDVLQQINEQLAALHVEDDDELEKSKQKAEASKADTDEKPAPEAHQAEHTDAAFQEITAAPELADLAELKLPEANQQQVVNSEVVASANPDKDFNDIVEHSLGAEAPGETRFHEQAPGEPPIDTGSGSELPPVPPTAEGGDWGSDSPEPWEQPAGGLGSANIRSDIDAVESRRQLDDLYHTSREHSLAGAVGLIGLGLVIEHILAKRRDKKLKKQINAQGSVLRGTNQELQQEQYAHQATQRKVERFNTAQTAMTEQLQSVMAARSTSELAKAGPAMTPDQEKVLADRLRHSKELGQAIKQNPELRRDVVDAGEQNLALQRSVEAVAATQEVSESKQETQFERLRSQYQDKDDKVRSGGTGTDINGMPVLPSPQQPTAGFMANATSGQDHADKANKSSSNITKPVAIATVLVLLAAILVMVYLH